MFFFPPANFFFSPGSIFCLSYDNLMFAAPRRTPLILGVSFFLSVLSFWSGSPRFPREWTLVSPPSLPPRPAVHVCLPMVHRGFSCLCSFSDELPTPALWRFCLVPPFFNFFFSVSCSLELLYSACPFPFRFHCAYLWKNFRHLTLFC